MAADADPSHRPREDEAARLDGGAATRGAGRRPTLVPKGNGQAPLSWRNSTRRVSSAVLLAADLGAWLSAVTLVYLARTVIWEPRELFWGLWLCGAGWFIVRAASELYTPFGLYPPEELRRSFRTTSVAFIVHLSILIATRELQPWRLAGLAVWPLVLAIGYFARAAAKAALARHRGYGLPFIVVGNGEKMARAIREMRGRAELGQVPVAVFSDEMTGQPAIDGVPVVGPIEAAASYSFTYRVRHAMVALSHADAGPEELRSLCDALARRYPSIQVFSDLTGRSNLLARPRPLGPYLTLEIQYGRFSARQRAMKRLFDLVIAGPALILSLPIIAAAAMAVKIRDPGPAFFSQQREGRDGQPIRIWKIRTMVQNAEAKLAQHLAANAAARFEYERTLKLRNDPRIIPTVGRFLRRYSIDELPQLWSIVKGDLSLVGPRVMLAHEVERFSADGQRLRRDVPPGLTGFWQVEHRNNSDLHIWEIADSFYVNNWSIWLDLWIVLRTFRVVVSGAGAY